MQTPSDRQRRREEAAEWFAALRAGLMPAESRAEFDRWRADPLNQAALDFIHVMWGELAALKSGDVPIRRRARGLAASVAATLVLVVAGGALTAVSMQSAGKSVETAIGQQRTQSLPDGSVLAVNVASRVTYVADEKGRRATLKTGEAAFGVRDDPAKSFVVRVGDFDVRSSRAEFNILMRDGRVEVAVSNGSVEVCKALGPEAGDAIGTLEAGHVLRFPAEWRRLAEDPPVHSTRPLKQVAEWRMRVMTYEDASVESVVADFNRFFDRKLVVADPSLAQRTVTLRLQVNDRSAAVATLASLLDARVRETENVTTIVGSGR